MVLRLEELLFPSTANVSVLAVGVKNETVRIEARSTASGSACPGCGSWSTRVHSSYLRFPTDVPSAGLRVLLCLRVRRFVCRVASFGRRTFVEQVPGLTRRYSRWTERLRSTLAAVGLALAGRAGARMASLPGSPERDWLRQDLRRPICRSRRLRARALPHRSAHGRSATRASWAGHFRAASATRAGASDG
ncbi:transposase family protein [Streptomyces meridianus]|uniref:Transposase family protein n=1 Tax=Streptomyces meridianus TaxID=2938945 RepID=A0ABT0XB46_9ACTN|nr:transposase family protein [Streptomyces meridianus]MCM2579727.1 transposase family protein [Streptomyces meridianus]